MKRPTRAELRSEAATGNYCPPGADWECPICAKTLLGCEHISHHLLVWLAQHPPPDRWFADECMSCKKNGRYVCAQGHGSRYLPGQALPATERQIPQAPWGGVVIRPTRAAFVAELNRRAPWPKGFCECPACGRADISACPCTGEISDWLNQHPAPDPWFAGECTGPTLDVVDTKPTPVDATGTPTRHGAQHLDGLGNDPAARKAAPIASGVLFYFPNALAAVAHLSKVGNEQHNPGQPMHWAFDKSRDEPDCILRHLAQSGTVDTDGIPHSVKVAWRALALLERELLATHPDMKPGKSVKNFKREL